ncbi:ABC transporter permease [Peptococcaceae bacterium 1198_IL3148]
MLKQCLTIMYREIFYMWRDKGLRYILLLGTLLGLLLFVGTYNAQVIKDIPTAVVDLDHSAASRDLIDKLTAAEYLNITTYPDSYQQAQQLIAQGRAMVAVVIPENFGRDVSLGRQTTIYTAIDGSNIVYATNANTAILTVTRTVSAQAGVKRLLTSGIAHSQAEEAYLGVSQVEEPWFNPTQNYAYFLVLALTLNIWQQCCTLLATTNVIGETGNRSWYQFKSIGFSKAKLFISKSIVHIITFMLLVMPVYLLCFTVLKMPLDQHLGTLLLFTLVFAISIHSIGTLVSSFARNAVDATRFGMIIALPSFVLSGYTWPLEAMPHWIQWLAKLLPQTWFFQGFNLLAFKDPSWPSVAQHFAVLLLIAVICYSVATIFVWRRS